ncbi:MAG: efflux RND transporter periplasmic adaptor subunit [Deltaproteobacteria bacterium]|nr:efflux RND transporter periplasmic adaptor subunit [Deltaproteobacteria bacterium]
MRRRRLVVTLALFALTGCREPEAATATAAPTAAAEGAFCKEHGVLEAVCTKCNPALIPVFKAKNDWCEAHGFPKSFCPICNPERGGRPAAEVADDGAPADGTKVRFKTKETARLAGLGFARVEERPRRSELTTTARVVYDAARVAQINARSPGVVRAIRADVGSQVRVGAPLAVIDSAGVGADQSRAQAARSRVQVAEAGHARVATLHAEGIAAQREVLAARQELETARAELAAAQAALGMVGGTADGAARYALTTPIAGVVTERHAALGRLVDTEATLFEVVDTSVMWAELDIPEAELPRVAVGQTVVLSVDGLADRERSGTLSYLAPAIDLQTRTVKGRVALANADGGLRANMFGRATISVTAPRPALMVPRAAVQRARSAQLVFVRLFEDQFEARRVQVGQADGALLEVTGRLQPGDEVVTDGSFLLKTETLKESIGAGCCDVVEGRR